MAIECMVWVLDLTGDINTNEKFVLLGIANHSSPDGTGSWPSVDTLCRYTRLSRSTVQRCIKSLVEKGYLSKEEGGGRRSNRYTLLMEKELAEVVELTLVTEDLPQSDTPDGAEGHPSSLPVLPQQSQALTQEPSYNRNRNEIETRDKKRKQDLVWDSIMEACGVNSTKLNSNERGRYNKAVKLLKESGATPAEIHARVQVYRRKFKGAACTPIAVANHWSELDPNTVPLEEVHSVPKGFDAIRQAREERGDGPN
ncbi:MAG: hypothetical protein CMM27_10630 [Rhodospirillaceae bacterium]|nr:hypothetical protein [Rhodospirillaceae bacterium]|tara:strand:+ start:3011 stop:3775 length:765 start_codon:yes stop_codon:yes gene_type:complete